MTNPPTTVTSDDQPGAEAQTKCVSCRHPMAAHDALSTRFCAATVSAGLERNCICPGVVSAAGELSNY